MVGRRKKKTRSFHASPAKALLLMFGCFAVFSVLFRYEMPRVNLTGSKKGRITLYPVQPESADAQWLEIHDPARIARGGDFPEAELRPEPGNAPKPEPVMALAKAVPVEPEAINRDRIPVPLPPAERQTGEKLVFQRVVPESYPRVTINGVKYAGNLPESLLKQAAAVNAGTVELRFSRGVLAEEVRVTVIRSSGSVRVDQVLAGYFAKHSFGDFPAVVRTVWDAAGEVEK